MNRIYELRDIARSKEVTASSVMGGWLATYPVDESPGCQGSFCSTYTKHPWWMVDLGQRAVVFNVTVLSEHSNFLNPFDIHIGDNKTTSINPICKKDATIVDLERKNFTCQELEGQFVSLYSHPTNTLSSRYLVFCEIKVYGIYLKSP